MCSFVQEFFPNMECGIFYMLLFVAALILGGGLVFLMNRKPESENQENQITYPDTNPVDEEEEEDGYSVLITLNMKDGSIFKIFCDSIDDKSFSGGSVTFYWYNCGLIAIEDGEGNELYTYDSDADSVEWGIDGVKTWHIEGA